MTVMRRAIASFRRQDWTAVVVELAVVMLGVFLGVQAANWNEDREQDRKSALFTERLKVDLRIEAWGYQYQAGYYSQVRDNAERAIDALTSEKPLSDEALLVAAYRATQFNEYSRRRATYDELVSTGQIGLIRDQQLRDLASQVFTTLAFDEIVEDGRASAYRKAFRMDLPYAVQQSIAKRCGDHVVPDGDYAGIPHVLDYPCTTGLPPTTIAVSAALLRKDPQLAALLQLQIVDIGSNLANFEVYFDGPIGAPLRRLAKGHP